MIRRRDLERCLRKAIERFQRALGADVTLEAMDQRAAKLAAAVAGASPEAEGEMR